jgi:hypothetical protein
LLDEKAMKEIANEVAEKILAETDRFWESLDMKDSSGQYDGNFAFPPRELSQFNTYNYAEANEGGYILC